MRTPDSTPRFPITRSWCTHRNWRVAARNCAPWTPTPGDVEEITDAEEGRWDYHASWSAAGDAVVFSRARVTEPPELWIASADGSGARRLSAGTTVGAPASAAGSPKQLWQKTAMTMASTIPRLGAERGPEA